MTNSYIALDLETTGLSAKHNKIIEVGALKVIDGEAIETYSSFANPRCRLSSQTTEITGITDEMLDGAEGMENLIDDIVRFCEDLPLLGHNIIFDYSFLKRAAVNKNIDFEKDGIDTLKLCRKFMPEDIRKNLGAACEYFNIEMQQAHRALSDAYAAHALYQELIKRYFMEDEKSFSAKTLVYKVKKEQPASKRQKECLRDLIKYHRINLAADIDYMSKNEISRATDKIISRFGKNRRGEICDKL